MNEALLWFLMTIGTHGQTTIHEVPYAVEWECRKVAETLEAEDLFGVRNATCFPSSAIDVNAWNYSQAGKWKFTEYE